MEDQEWFSRIAVRNFGVIGREWEITGPGVYHRGSRGRFQASLRDSISFNGMCKLQKTQSSKSNKSNTKPILLHIRSARAEGLLAHFVTQCKSRVAESTTTLSANASRKLMSCFSFFGGRACRNGWKLGPLSETYFGVLACINALLHRTIG